MPIVISNITDFQLLEMEKSSKSIILLGYQIKLTETEYRITELLFSCNMPMHKEKISNILGINLKSIPVHIASINKKALPISRRRLIEGNRCGEYRIAEYI